MPAKPARSSACLPHRSAFSSLEYEPGGSQSPRHPSASASTLCMGEDPSPSYYAQVMFASCVGDHTLDSSISGTGDRFFYSVTASPDKLCVKLVNASSTGLPVTISLNGLGAGTHTVRIDTLKANTTWATNTIAHPDRIVPVRSTASVKGERVQHVMPGYAIQTLEIDLK